MPRCVLDHLHHHQYFHLIKASKEKIKNTKESNIKEQSYAHDSPHEAMIGSPGWRTMDLMLPEHFPVKHPNNFPVRPKQEKRPIGFRLGIHNVSHILSK